MPSHVPGEAGQPRYVHRGLPSGPFPRPLCPPPRAQSVPAVPSLLLWEGHPARSTGSASRVGCLLQLA